MILLAAAITLIIVLAACYKDAGAERNKMQGHKIVKKEKGTNWPVLTAIIVTAWIILLLVKFCVVG